MHIEERETILRIGYGPDGQASIWTTERAVMARCRKAGWKMEQEARSQRGAIVGQEWVAGVNDIKISVKKPGRPKIMTGYALKGDR